jgi:hypothetical protein
MAAIRVVLYENGGRSIEFCGTSNIGNGTYSLNALVVPCVLTLRLMPVGRSRSTPFPAGY